MRKAGATFLLIEDDANDVLFVEQEFNTLGWSRALKVVSDGIEAVRYLEGTHGYEDRSKFPMPTVVVLDLKMPRFSGFDFLNWLRTQAPSQLNWLPVVVLSSSHLPEDILRAYVLGVSAYMVKPGNWAQFRSRLQALLAYWGEHVETPEFQAPAARDLSRPRPQPRPAASA